MRKLLLKYFDQISKINNQWQLIGYIFAGLLLLVIISTSSAIFVKVLSVIALAIIIFLYFDRYFQYRESKEWVRRTSESLSSQDPTKTPAYVASVGIERKLGRKTAYEHILREIIILKSNKRKDKLEILVDIIKGALGGLN